MESSVFVWKMYKIKTSRRPQESEQRQSEGSRESRAHKHGRKRTDREMNGG